MRVPSRELPVFSSRAARLHGPIQLPEQKLSSSSPAPGGCRRDQGGAGTQGGSRREQEPGRELKRERGCREFGAESSEER